MLDVPEHRIEEQAREDGPRELHQDVTRHAPPGEVVAQSEGDGRGGVEVGARDRAHEEDDRHDHEPRRHHGRGEADLAPCVQDCAAGGDEH